MTSISKLIFGAVEPNDGLRYAPGVHARPIVVWNVTPACNLACAHCYAAAGEDAGSVLNMSFNSYLPSNMNEPIVSYILTHNTVSGSVE